MYSQFWRVMFMTFMFGIMFSNIAFAFNVVQLVNPTAIDGDYVNSYFGMSSLIDSFKTFFGNNSGIKSFSDFLVNFGKRITQRYNMYREFSNRLFPSANNSAWDIISAIFALIAFTNSIIDMLILLIYIILYAVFLIAFVFSLISFVFYWFGGGFLTPLPSTDWWDYNQTILPSLNYAMMV